MAGSLAIDNPFVIVMKLQEFHQQKNDRRRDPQRQISQEGKGWRNFIYAKEMDQHSGGAMADMNRRCFMKMLSGAALTTPGCLRRLKKGSPRQLRLP
jgi:hypothetical protein